MKKTNLDRLILKIKNIYKDLHKSENRYLKEIRRVHPLYKKSAKNFTHYIALRRHNLNDTQEDLGNLGLSRLGKCEHHVTSSILSTLNTLNILNNKKFAKKDIPLFTIKKAKRILNSNTKSLLGYRSKNRRARIMVTLPTEAATDRKLIQNLISAGMNSARINCAHNDEDTWYKMILNVKKANKATGKKCKIVMDLGGPKIRTGSIAPKPKIIRVQPEKDFFGKNIRTKYFYLSKINTENEEKEGISIPIKGNISDFKVGNILKFKDAQGKIISIPVIKRSKNYLYVGCNETIYFTPGIILKRDIQDKKSDEITIEDFSLSENKILIRPGEILILDSKPIPGENAKLDPRGKLISHAHISCTYPEIIKLIKIGDPIFFDDGKIGGKIISRTKTNLKIRITLAKETGNRLGADKGINLPKSKISLKGILEKDKKDLKFISKHADIASVSFVNSEDDVKRLLKYLKKIKSKLGLIIKIETRQGLKNLPKIILTSMRTHPIGIMIARGDLAIECGWEEMARIQEEILRFCGAAHIPVIWATQVLENLAKKGTPLRSEITDAAISQRSECVMLNKGPFILNAIKMLDHILKDLDPYMRKFSPMLPNLKKIDIIDI